MELARYQCYSNEMEDQAFGIANNKKSFGILLSHIRVPGFEFLLYIQFQLPPKIHSGRQQVMSQILMCLPFM